MKRLSFLFLILVFCTVVMIGLCACGEESDQNDKEQCIHAFEDATCTVKKTCSVCGETEGEALGHFYKDGICVDCGAVDKLGKYLVFDLNDDETAYTIKECSSDISGKLIIPEMYNRKPVTSIGDEAFYRCDELTSIEIPNSIESVGRSAFPDPKYGFEYNKKQGGCYIGNDENPYLIFVCAINTSVTEVNVSPGTKIICPSALSECEKLLNVEIPSSVTYIGKEAFFSCSSLLNFEVEDRNNYYKSVEGVLYSADGKMLIAYPAGKKETEYKILEGVTSVDDSAFYNCGNLINIVIPNSVTHVAASAFGYCDSLVYNEYKNGKYLGNEENPYLLFSAVIDKNATSFEINEKAKIVGYGSFWKCENLTSVTIPDGVVSIEELAFRDCRRLENIQLPSSLTFIGEYAFWGCRSLKRITIPDSVVKIGAYLFYECASLESVKLSKELRSVENHTFYGCASLTTVEIPASVTRIGEGAFAGCVSLTSVEFPVDVTRIEETAFFDCTSLANVKIPKGVKNIGDRVFYNCDGLTKVVIPSNITDIAKSAFAGCDNLTSFEVEEGNEQYKSIDGNIYSKDGKSLAIYASGKKEKRFVVPNGVVTIEHDAFVGCDNFESVEISASVTTIGDHAFYYCTALTSVEISNGVTTIGDYAFSNCEALTSIEIPASVTTIGDGAFFRCTALTSVEISNGVTTIGDYAFSNCEALTSIEIPDSVTAIEEGAFSSCKALTSIEIPASVTTIGDYAFEFCWRLVNIEIPASVTYIGENAFFIGPQLECNEYKNGLYLGNDENPYLVFVGMNDTSATSLVVHSNTKFILQNTVHYFKNLTEIQVEEGNGYYKSIDGNLYSGDGKTLIRYAIAKADTTFQIPKGVTTIEKMAFSESVNLTGVEIPASVTAIGEGAFNRCANLTRVVIPSSVTTIGTQVFFNCDKLTIYCEIAEEDVPKGWDGHWNLSARPVIWDYKAE